jgi:hypothetical protein
MSNQSMNPLAKYFRQPAIHLSLPSLGKFWPIGSLEMNMSNQIEVYPMTTRDEITIRTPDALLNGSSMVSLFQSCCPQIKDAWKMPGCDVDAILIAIRIASYGQNMDIDTICTNPECKNENKHELDLTVILDSIKSPNYNKTVDVSNIKIKLKPITYFDNNKSRMLVFEQDRAIAAATDQSMPDEEKLQIFQKHLDKMIEINAELMVAATEYIETPDQQKVDNVEFITEFYNNCDRKIISEIRNRIDEYAKSMTLPKPKIKCDACDTEYTVEVGFDYANFFANAS